MSKIKKKYKKPTTMKTKDGKEVKIIEDEEEPSEEVIDETTGKRKPKTKKIMNKDGEIEEVKEIVEDIPFSNSFLQIEKFETDNKIFYYTTKIKKFNDEINSINEKNKYNKKELENGLG